MLIQRKVAIDNMDLVLIPLRQRRKQLLHASSRSTGTPGRRSRRSAPEHSPVHPAPDRPSPLTSSFGSLLMSYLLNCASVLPSVESRKIDRLARLAIRRKGHADRVEARNLALRPRTDLDIVVRRNGRLRADQHLNATRQLRRKLSRSLRRGLRVAAKSSQRKGKNQGTKRLHNSRHNTSIISRSGQSPRHVQPARKHRSRASSKQARRPPQIARRPDIHQREVEPLRRSHSAPSPARTSETPR